jgi:hypothetical protein
MVSMKYGRNFLGVLASGTALVLVNAGCLRTALRDGQVLANKSIARSPISAG